MCSAPALETHQIQAGKVLPKSKVQLILLSNSDETLMANRKRSLVRALLEKTKT